MSGRRSSRQDGLPSATALLDALAPGRSAICAAMAGVRISSPTYAALDAAIAALDRLAADLGHEGRFLAALHGTPTPRE